MAWKLDGTELGTNTVTVNVIPRTTARTTERLQRSGIPGEGERVQHAGQQDANLTLTFRCIGPIPDIHNEADFIQTQVEDGNVFTIESPSSPDVRLWRGEDRIACIAQTHAQVINQGVNHVDVQVQAVVQGAWQADGGAYVEPVDGHFTQQSDGTFTDEDGNNDTIPSVEVPQQEDGHPLAVRRSDFTKVEPPWVSTRTVTDRDGDITRLETYDLTDFHVPQMTSTDDVGVFELDSSPAVEYLSGVSALNTENLTTEAGENLQTESGEDLLSQGTA